VVLALPATAVFLTLSREIITPFQSGRFDRAAALRVAPLVTAYGFALLGNASGRLFSTAFYALGDTKTPARYAFVRVIASTAFSVALMRPFGVLGVVLGAVIAAWVETAMLAVTLRRQIGGLGFDAVPIVRVLAVALLGLAALAFVAGARALGLLDVRTLLRRR
jgi:putative peptidoglycan lipid II flippase